MSERTHELKTWPEPFQAMIDGRKQFELRRNDRGFAVGDHLLLREWDPTPCPHVPEGYTGRSAYFRVTYVLHGGRFGLPSEFCVMSVEKCDA